MRVLQRCACKPLLKESKPISNKAASEARRSPRLGFPRLPIDFIRIAFFFSVQNHSDFVSQVCVRRSPAKRDALAPRTTPNSTSSQEPQGLRQRERSDAQESKNGSAANGSEYTASTAACPRSPVESRLRSNNRQSLRSTIAQGGTEQSDLLPPGPGVVSCSRPPQGALM
jgi:hypothetical protein